MQERAKQLRQNMTDAENRLWYYLRNRRLNGYKFVRQHVIGHYIVDFLYREKKLIIELDGGQHMSAAEYDERRTEYLERCGYQVLRIWNDEIFKNIDGVMESILNIIEAVPASPPSSPALLPRGRREQIELASNSCASR